MLFINTKYKDSIISFSLGLAFSVMLLISILELIPIGIGLLVIEFNLVYVFIIGIVSLLFGYFIVSVIDNRIDSNDKLYKIGVLSMISLFIHNVPEGIIASITSSKNLLLGIKLSFIVLIHNIPEGICIILPVYYSTGSRGKAILMTFISSLGELFGAVITLLFLKNYINDLVLSIIYIVTGGIMITLSIFKIYKEGLSYKRYKWFILGVLIGISIIILTL